MNKRILPAIAALALMTACGKSESEAKVEPKPAASTTEPSSQSGVATIPVDSPQLAQIKVEPVAMAMVAVDTVSSPGKVEANANRTAHVVLPLTGRVIAVNTKIGDFVSQGQPLLTVETAASASVYH